MDVYEYASLTKDINKLRKYVSLKQATQWRHNGIYQYYFS